MVQKVRNVQKNLAGMEDLLHTLGSTTQVRNGEDVQVHGVDIPLTVGNSIELQNLDVTQWTYARIYQTPVEYKEYKYSETDTSGIPSVGGAGSWLEISLAVTVAPSEPGSEPNTKGSSTILDQITADITVGSTIASVSLPASVPPGGSTTDVSVDWMNRVGDKLYGYGYFPPENLLKEFTADGDTFTSTGDALAVNLQEHTTTWDTQSCTLSSTPMEFELLDLDTWENPQTLVLAGSNVYHKWVYKHNNSLYAFSVDGTLRKYSPDGQTILFEKQLGIEIIKAVKLDSILLFVSTTNARWTYNLELEELETHAMSGPTVEYSWFTSAGTYYAINTTFSSMYKFNTTLTLAATLTATQLGLLAIAGDKLLLPGNEELTVSSILGVNVITTTTSPAELTYEGTTARVNEDGDVITALSTAEGTAYVVRPPSGGGAEVIKDWETVTALTKDFLAGVDFGVEGYNNSVIEIKNLTVTAQDDWTAKLRFAEALGANPVREEVTGWSRASLGTAATTISNGSAGGTEAFISNPYTELLEVDFMTITLNQKTLTVGGSPAYSSMATAEAKNVLSSDGVGLASIRSNESICRQRSTSNVGILPYLGLTFPGSTTNLSYEYRIVRGPKQ